MPVVTITLMKDHDEDTRTTMAERLTDAVLSTIAAPPEGATVIINEVEAVGYMRGRQGRVPGKPLPNAKDVVRAYLDAMEGRDLDGAKAHLAEGFMTFPGRAVFTAPEELVEWARPRYRRVAKVHEAMESFARTARRSSTTAARSTANSTTARRLKASALRRPLHGEGRENCGSGSVERLCGGFRRGVSALKPMPQRAVAPARADALVVG